VGSTASSPGGPGRAYSHVRPGLRPSRARGRVPAANTFWSIYGSQNAPRGSIYAVVCAQRKWLFWLLIRLFEFVVGLVWVPMLCFPNTFYDAKCVISPMYIYAPGRGPSRSRHLFAVWFQEKILEATSQSHTEQWTKQDVLEPECTDVARAIENESLHDSITSVGAFCRFQRLQMTQNVNIANAFPVFLSGSYTRLNNIAVLYYFVLCQALHIFHTVSSGVAYDLRAPGYI